MRQTNKERATARERERETTEGERGRVSKSLEQFGASFSPQTNKTNKQTTSRSKGSQDEVLDQDNSHPQSKTRTHKKKTQNTEGKTGPKKKKREDRTKQANVQDN